MTEAERRALGQTRRLVFSNIANGVPEERVMADMLLSKLEIEQALRFVSKKITEYLVLRRQAPIACASVREIRYSRRDLLGVLAKIGNLDLSTDLILARITIQSLDHPEMIDGAKHRMEEINLARRH